MTSIPGVFWNAFCAAAFLIPGATTALAANRVESPDGKVAVEFLIQTGGIPAYKIEYLGKPIVLESRLGLPPDFTNGFEIEKSSRG